MTDLVQKLVGALEDCLDDSHQVLAQMEQMYGTNYRQNRLESQRKIIADAEAALSAAKDGGWLPIETAPKDGTEVFVYVPGDSLFPTAAAYKSADYFEKEYGDREYMEEGWYWAFGYPSDFHECVITPTAWQPLPTPPKEQSAVGLGLVDAVADPRSATE